MAHPQQSPTRPLPARNKARRVPYRGVAANHLWLTTRAAAVNLVRLTNLGVTHKDVLNVVGFARTTLWRRVKSGDFPQPVRLGGAGSRAVGWRSGEVERWLAERQSV